MAELIIGAPIITLEEQFNQVSKNFPDNDGEVLIKYWFMNKVEDMESFMTSHHLYGDSLFPRYLYEGVMGHGYACIRKDHQAEDLWKIFKKHGIRALAPPHGYDGFNPIKGLKRTPISDLRFNFIGAMDRTVEGAKVVPLSTLLDKQVIDEIEKKAIDEVKAAKKSWFTPIPGI